MAAAVPRDPDRRVGFVTYVTAVAVAAVLSVALAMGELPDPWHRSSVAPWVMAVLAVLVDARPFTVPGRSHATVFFPSVCLTFALLLGWGLAVAVIVQAVAVLASSIRLRYPPWRALYNASQYALAFTAAAAVLAVAGVPPLTSVTAIDVAHLAVVFAAALTWFVVDEVLATTAMWLHDGGRWSVALSTALVEQTLSTVPLLAMSPLVVIAVGVNPAFVLLMLVPLVAVREMARYSEQERRKARRDELTGLPNRKALVSLIRAQERSYAAHSVRGRVQPWRMGLLLLDVDQFRQVNEALGHAAGDRLLCAIADRLSQCVGADGAVARLGGDEFAVLAPRLTNAQAGMVLARRVAAAFSEPIRLDGLQLEMSAGIGLAVYPDHGRDSTALLRHAEIAMYDSKERSAAYAVYSPESEQNSAERLELLADLRGALDAGRPDEIQLFYQPQVDLTSGNVVGVEALLRWHHAVRGMVSPDQLIKMAEHTAVMRVLTQRVLDDAMAQMAKWRAHGLFLRASVNVSVRDLQRPEFVDELTASLADRGVPPNQLQLEITEGALMSDPRRVLVSLHRLDTLGVALSLDDFGTGYSSLQHLRRLPLAEVKIDRSFVLGMSTDPDDAAVVRSIIDLARALGLRVVAEGVEDDITRRMLVEGGCEVGQGWFYARPMPADDLMGWLARYRPAVGRAGPDK